MTDLISRADAFAERHFLAHNIRRKYTNEPYMTHPREVADIVRTVPHDEAMIAAALLHDTVEDIPEVAHDDILELFGADVWKLVRWLTDVSQPTDGNRERRKLIDRNHSLAAPARAQTIKLADLISNSRSIVALDHDFAKVYMREKRLLLDVLTKGDRELWRQADEICRAAGY